jgi:hypothetical protein
MNILEVLEEKIEEINESVYDSDKLDSLTEYIYQKIRGKERVKIDILNKSREYFPWITKSALFYVTARKSLSTGLGYSQAENNFKENKSRIPITYIKINVSTLSPYLKRYIKHELIHCLDYFRSYKAKRKIMVAANSASYDYKYLSYRKDIYEFNEAINELQKYKDSDEYNKINNIDDLMSFVFIKTSAKGKMKKNTTFIVDKHFIKDESLRKRLITRLTRENMLPKAMRK